MTDIEKIHYTLLIIMNEIDRICKKNNISYSLVAGSLLGAVRHQGFIPWDDDMDIGMLRDQYDYFIKCCETDLSEKFELLTLENDPDYPYSFAKIVLKGTKIVQLGYEEASWNKGFYIDVFPLDDIPDTRFKQVSHNFFNYLYVKIIERKTSSYIVDKDNIIKVIGFRILDIAAKFITLDSLKRKLQKNCIKYNNQGYKYVCSLGSIYGYKRESANKQYFLHTERVPFENSQFDIIKDYDPYLTGVYGNYMEIPPVEKRHIHNFVELDFGDLFEE